MKKRTRDLVREAARAYPAPTWLQVRNPTVVTAVDEAVDEGMVSVDVFAVTATAKGLAWALTQAERETARAEHDRSVLVEQYSAAHNAVWQTVAEVREIRSRVCDECRPKIPGG